MNQMNMLEVAPVFGLDIGTRSVVGTIGYKRGETFVVVAQEIREHRQEQCLMDRFMILTELLQRLRRLRRLWRKRADLSFVKYALQQQDVY